MTLDQKIEAVLFFKAEPIALEKLAQILGIGEDETRTGIAMLEEKLSDRGIAIIQKDGAVMIGTIPAASAIIEELTKEELSRELGNAGLETLSIILYRGPITRSKIDYIRGVNSTFILRNLLVRGLVERVPNPGDQRSFLYRSTFELLTHLGVSHIEELPEYDAVRREVAEFETQELDSEEDDDSAYTQHD